MKKIFTTTFLLVTSCLSLHAGDRLIENLDEEHSSAATANLREVLHGDLAWQILDNFKIPSTNVKVEINRYEQYGDIFNALFDGHENKKVSAGIFHPDPLVRNSVGDDPICKK